MVKVNQITDSKNKKLLFSILGVLFIAAVSTIILSSLSSDTKPIAKYYQETIIEMPVVYETAPINFKTKDNNFVQLELYIEPYNQRELKQIRNKENIINFQLKETLSQFSYSELAQPQNRTFIKNIIKKQIDLVLYPSTIKNLHLNFVRQ